MDNWNPLKVPNNQLLFCFSHIIPSHELVEIIIVIINSYPALPQCMELLVQSLNVLEWKKELFHLLLLINI